MPIQSLPNELLLHIISLLAVASAEDLETSYWNRTRLRDLRAATLVSRTWQRLAQPILWEEVRLLNNTQVSNFVAGTAATGLTTATLRLFEDDSHRLAALAVGSCAGLRKLELWDLWDVDVEILFSPALAQLVFDYQYSEKWLKDWPPQLVPRIFQPSITTLDLHHPIILFYSLFDPLDTVAPNLVTLYLRPNDPTLSRPLRPFFAACHSPRHLLTGDLAEDGVEDIPSMLDYLTLDDVGWYAGQMVDLLRKEVTAFSRLKQLCYTSIDRASVEATESYHELRVECEKRGIELVFRGEGRYC